MIELTVKVDPSVIESAVRDAWNYQFGKYGKFGSTYPAATLLGYEAVKKQVRGYIEHMDLSFEIAKVAKAQLSGVIEEVVKAELRAAARKAAREMRNDGTLFVDVPKF